MAVAGRILTLRHVDNHHAEKLQALAFLNRNNAQQIYASFRSLREVHAFVRSSTAFWAIERSVIVSTLRVLSLTLDWIDVPSRPNATRLDCAIHLLTRLGSLPLLEDLTLVIANLASPSGDWDKWFTDHPSAVSQLYHLSLLRRLTVSIEILPMIWSAASELPLLVSLVAVKHATSKRHPPSIILPFTQDGFCSLESIELPCSWARAQALFLLSTDHSFVPRLRTVVLRLPGSEIASGLDFQHLLHRMRPVQDQLQHLIFDGREQQHPQKYEKLSLDDLDGLSEFTALHQLCLPVIKTEIIDPLLHDLIDDFATSLDIVTVLRPMSTLGPAAAAANAHDPHPVIHTMFLDSESCRVIQHTYPAIAVEHMRPMGPSIQPQKEWFFSPPIVMAPCIPVAAQEALCARFPYKLHVYPFGRVSTCQFGRQVWCDEDEIDPAVRGMNLGYPAVQPSIY